jgi:hypothetical protein
VFLDTLSRDRFPAEKACGLNCVGGAQFRTEPSPNLTASIRDTPAVRLGDGAVLNCMHTILLRTKGLSTTRNRSQDRVFTDTLTTLAVYANLTPQRTKICRIPPHTYPLRTYSTNSSIHGKLVAVKKIKFPFFSDKHSSVKQ